MDQDIVPPAIVEILRASGLDYEVMPCEPELADTAVFCEHYGQSLEDSVNTIVVKAKTGGERYAACALLAPTRLDVNRCVRKRLASRRVSFASAEETARVTGMTIGGVTPLGLPPDLPLWVDARVMRAERDHPRRRHPPLENPRPAGHLRAYPRRGDRGRPRLRPSRIACGARPISRSLPSSPGTGPSQRLRNAMTFTSPASRTHRDLPSPKPEPSSPKGPVPCTARFATRSQDPHHRCGALRHKSVGNPVPPVQPFRCQRNG